MTGSEYPPSLAPFDTLPGMLQRGRGAGFLSALREPPARVHELLVECITRDPRWDHQLESRGIYYGELVDATSMDISVLESHLRQNDDADEFGWRTPLTIETLACLVGMGRTDAIKILQSYIEYGHWWDLAIRGLGCAEDVSVFTGLDERICSRIPNDEELQFRCPMILKDEEPWNSWQHTNPRIARMMVARHAQAESGPDQPASSLDWDKMGITRLFEIVDEENRHRIGRVLKQKVVPSDLAELLRHLASGASVPAYLALVGLQRLALPESLPALLRYAEADGAHPPWMNRHLIGAIVALPAETTRPFAHSLFHHASLPMRILADRILAAQATPENLPLLLAAVPAALASDDMYRLRSVLTAFQRLPDLGPWPELEVAFEQAPYSWARLRAAEALARMPSHRFAERHAFECLWDCERDTREIGCANVSLSMPEARRRLQAIADDPCEVDELRGAARRRLGAI